MDPLFHHNHGPFTAAQIKQRIGAELMVNGDAAPDSAYNIFFKDVASLDQAKKDDLAFLDNPKYIAQFEQSKAGACIVHPKHVQRAPQDMLLFVTEQPYSAYATIATQFYPNPDGVIEKNISPHAHIASDAEISSHCWISSGVVIESGAHIGSHCMIGANVWIGKNVRIGDHTHIGANSTISHAMIGKHVVIHRGVHIGQDGFGFAPGPQGIVKVPQLGRVIIEDHVDIGSGTCIDRGAGPDTVIGAHTKIDNLVQIGHNVHIGSYCFLAGQVGIAGSAKIGNGVMMGGHAGTAGHVTIGDNAKLAGFSGNMVDIPAGATYVGAPARPQREFFKIQAMLNKMLKGKKDE